MFKLRYVLDNAPRDPVSCELVGTDELIEYLYSKGVRVLDTAWSCIYDEYKRVCGHCGNQFKDEGFRFCPFCGARFLANILVDKNTIFKIYKDGAKETIGRINYKWKKWEKKKFRMKVRAHKENLKI
jgi:hypothetical protein